MAGNCIDTDLIELVARNVVFKLLNEHTLQAGLRSCGDTCDWLGHESKVATCAQLDAAIAGVAVGDTIEDFEYNPSTGQLTITTDQSTYSVVLPTPDDAVNTHAVALVLGADNVLRLTLNDGTVLAATFQPLVDMVEAFTDKFLSLVSYDQSAHTMTFEVGSDSGSNSQTFTINLSDLIPITVAPNVCLDGIGTVASPLSLDIECLAAHLSGQISAAVAVCSGTALVGNGTEAAPLCLDTSLLDGNIAVAVGNTDECALLGDGTTANPLCVSVDALAERVAVAVCSGTRLSGSGTADDPLCFDETAQGVTVGVDCALTGDGTPASPLCVDPVVLGGQVPVTVGADCGLTGDGTEASPLCVSLAGRIVSGDDCIVVTPQPDGTIVISLAGCGDTGSTPPAPSSHTLTLSGSPSSAAEGSTFTFTATLNAPVSGAGLSLSFVLSGTEQTAHSYTSPRTVYFGVGESVKTFTVVTVNDAAGGAATALTATMTADARITNGTPSATVTVTANAVPASTHTIAGLSVAPTSDNEGAQFCWTVTLDSAVSGGALTLGSVLSGTEQAAHSYAAPSVIIPNGSNTGQLCVTTVDDSTGEADKNLCLNIAANPRILNSVAAVCATVHGNQPPAGLVSPPEWSGGSDENCHTRTGACSNPGITARQQIVFKTDGTWQIRNGVTGSILYSSGVWITGGFTSADYEVQLTGTVTTTEELTGDLSCDGTSSSSVPYDSGWLTISSDRVLDVTATAASNYPCVTTTTNSLSGTLVVREKANHSNTVSAAFSLCAMSSCAGE